MFAVAVSTIASSGWAQGVRDYVLELEPETASARFLRHEQIELRRRGPVVMVHRGASALAPENTLPAYARAMDLGADGVEVDVRRTADGVLVLFHDEVLDRVTHGIGSVGDLNARALLALEPRRTFGRPLGGTPPSFLQLLDLARQRAMLLHLDVKEDGLEADMAGALDAADCWDHVVAINAPHAASLIASPRFRPLRYKVPGLYAERRDLDPTEVAQALRQPGEMILVDDPRVAVRILGRVAYAPVPLTQTFRYGRREEAPAAGGDGARFNGTAHLDALTLRINPDSRPQLISLIEAPLMPPGPGGEHDDPQLQRARRIVERAWAADRLGRLGRKPPAVVHALERLVEMPGVHPDWRYHGLDGALAARALGRLGAIECAPAIVTAFRRTRVSDDTLPDGAVTAASAAWAESRFKLHLLAALGDLRCRTARRFLLELVAPEGPTSATGSSSVWFEDATRALLRQNLTWDGIGRLLRNPNPAVRGTAILECVDWPNEERRKALAASAGWALALPHVPYATLAPAPIRRERAGVRGGH